MNHTTNVNSFNLEQAVQICLNFEQNLRQEAFLKGLRNYNRKVFLCPPQKNVEIRPTFSTAISQNKFTFRYIKLIV